MKTQNNVDATKKAKNIAAVLYLLVLTFLVGGSYIHQHRDSGDAVESSVYPQ
ncbi:MAG: hypothetical protein PHH11_04730 [Methylomonas sp.]|nr:hypothetical protein [Methylomonas sp.]